MKVLIAILAVIAVSAAEWNIKTQEDLIKARTECVQSLTVPAEYVEKFKKWDFPDDETTRCYIKCVFEKFGIFEAEKGFDADRLVQQLSQNRNQDEVRVDVNKCVESSEHKADACVWAYKGLKCFLGKHLSLVQESVKN